MDIQCDGGGPFTVNSAGGPGNLHPYFTGADDELLFQAAAYRGIENLDGVSNWNKAYWNVAMGLHEGSFPTLQNCTAYTLASASNGNHFEFGQTPPNVRWPAVEYNITLVTDGNLTCGKHSLGDGTGVQTIYTGDEGHRFYANYRSDTEETEIELGDPDWVVVNCSETEAPSVATSPGQNMGPGEFLEFATNPDDKLISCTLTPFEDVLQVPVRWGTLVLTATGEGGADLTGRIVESFDDDEIRPFFEFQFVIDAADTDQPVVFDVDKRVPPNPPSQPDETLEPVG
ncbi:MAG: hypothetical protein GY704_05835, partial [Phycisphaeraceae bacterium]|nr:hypothetical protein [Phycisphaeraceae bacterium]